VASLTVLLATAGLSLPGCSLGGYGIAATQIQHAHSAVLYTVHAPGLQVRLGADDRGASAGYTVRTCIARLQPDTPASGWYLGHDPRAPTCLARDLVTWGVEARVTPQEVSAGVGLRHTVIVAQIPAGQSSNYLLKYSSSNPASTRLEELK